MLCMLTFLLPQNIRYGIDQNTDFSTEFLFLFFKKCPENEVKHFRNFIKVSIQFKYNEVLDKCVLTAELVSQYSGEEYKKRLSAVDKLNKYLRDGFPTNLLHALNNPDYFNIHPVSQVAENEPHLRQLPMSPLPLLDQELSVFRLPYPVDPVNESQPPYCKDTYQDDEYMFPANIFDTPITPKCPTPPHTSSPLEGTVFTTLTSVPLTAVSALKFHPSINNPGRSSSKRSINFVWPTTPKRKRLNVTPQINM